MQLDLQSVEKVPFSTFACAFAPKMLEISLPRLRMSRRFLQDLSKRFVFMVTCNESTAVSLFSRGPVAGDHRQHFFDSSGSNIITTPDRIEKTFFFNPIGYNCNRI